MKMIWFSFLVLFLLSGCITPAVQTEFLLVERGDLPISYIIEDVAFTDQTLGFCGPATLTMAMEAAGEKVQLEELAKQVYTPGFQGSIQADMVSASRRQGMMAIPIHNLSDLLKEISAGHPVIVFENLGFAWASQWHYVLIVGFDLNRQEIIMHSGHQSYVRQDMKKFERSWMLGEYWGLVVLPAGQLAATENEQEHVVAAVGLELAKKSYAAEKSYRKILEKWPKNLVALIGLANVVYVDGDYQQAVSLLQRAIVYHPKSEAAHLNLAVAEGALVDLRQSSSFR
jgi:tetratricopeptide (TPR) repeat protein